MRDVVIIGGGVTGLAAARELDRAGIRGTLIEVKPRLGGSITSLSREDFILDAGPMLTLDSPDAPFLTELGLQDQVAVVREDEDGAYLAFKSGTGKLIEALAAGLRHTFMMRMAVSTIGRMDYTPDSRFSICMENGMVLDTRAIIVTAPARYAERIFHTLKPEISYRLLDYRYDSIARVSLGYRREDAPVIPAEPHPDYPVSYIHSLTLPERVPPDHVLIQAGVRYDPAKGLSPDVVGELAALMNWKLNPVVEEVSIWGETEPLMWLDDNHSATMQTIQHLLPDGVALAGSDYVITDHRPTLQERISAGQQAARQIITWLQTHA